MEPTPTPESPGPPSPAGGACADCGAPLCGPFCAACGQKSVDVDRPLRDFVGDLLDNLAALDSRVLRTLRLLLLHPGRLTAEYLAGRRTRYVPPLKLYLFVSFCFFLLATFLPLQIVHDSAPGETRPSGVNLTVERKAPADDPGATSDEKDPAEGGETFEERVDRAVADPEAFGRSFSAHLAKVVFLLVPLFAIGPQLLFRRPPRVYFHHLIYSLHLHAFGFLVAALVLALGRVPWIGTQGAGLLNLSLPIYLFLSLRHVYGEGRGRTAWKAFVLTVGHLVVLMLVLLATVFATVVL